MAEVCEITSSKRIFAADYVSEGVPFYRGKEITEKYKGNLDVSTELFISEEKFREIERKFGAPKTGDLLLTSVGTLGSPYVAKPGERFYFKDGNLTWFRHFNGLDSRFLYFWLVSPQGREQLKRCTIGVAQPALTIVALKGMEIELPPLPVQRRIAGILSAYDELMENCQRRIRILEEMARALYREWFVHFRFPGHEKGPRVDSPLGPIPKGWQTVAFTEIADILSGGTPKTDVPEYWAGTIPFFTPRDVPDCFYVLDTDKHTNDLGLSKCASELYPPDTVFITARGTVGKVAMPSVPMAMNQSCYALRGKPGIPQHFVFLMTLQQVDYLKTNTGGATFDTIVVDTFRRMDVAKPPLDLIARFARLTDATFTAINNLAQKVANLRRTRDLLLPRLLSGQVPLDVSEDVAEPTTSAPPPRLPRSQTPFGNALAGETPFRGGGEARAKAEEATELRGQARAQIEFGHEVGEEEPALREAEEAPPNPRNTGFQPVRTAGFQPAEPAACGQDARGPHSQDGCVSDETPVPIHQTERADVLQIIRQVFSEGPPRPRDDAIRDVARALGYRRTGARIAEVLHADLRTAVRRGILENTDGTLRLCARSITDLDRDFLKAQFLAAIGRPWIDRDTAIRDFYRWLGFARAGPIIEDTARSLINGLLRECRLEADGAELIRRV